MLDFEEASDGLYQPQAVLQLLLQIVWGWGREGWSRGRKRGGSRGCGAERDPGKGGGPQAGTPRIAKCCFSRAIVRGVAGEGVAPGGEAGPQEGTHNPGED